MSLSNYIDKWNTASLPAKSLWDGKDVASLNAQEIKDMVDATAASYFAPGALSAAMGMPSSSNKFTDSNMQQMLASRMGWNMNAPRCPFDRITPYKLNEEKAVVFAIKDGKAMIFEDDLHLFPSDALVTQLRLLGDK